MKTVTTLVVVGVVVATAMMAFAFAPQAKSQPAGANVMDLSGVWDGDADGKKEWGTVNLKALEDGYIGTYTDTYNGNLGSMSFKQVGERKYQGRWWETSLTRHGSFELQASENGREIHLTWKTDQGSAYAPKDSKSSWKVRE